MRLSVDLKGRYIGYRFLTSQTYPTIWAKIRQNVKNLPLRVNVINLDFFFFLKYPYGSTRAPLVPKNLNAMVELFRFLKYVEGICVLLDFYDFTEIHTLLFLTFLTSAKNSNSTQKMGEPSQKNS